MSGDWPPAKSYVIGSILNWLLFLAGVALLVAAQRGGFLTPWLGWPVVLLIAGSVLGQFVVAYRSIARQDEFVRAITFKQGITAAGITICLAVFWGMAEQFLGMPSVPMWFAYPVFWGVFGMVTPFIRSSRA